MSGQVPDSVRQAKVRRFLRATAAAGRLATRRYAAQRLDDHRVELAARAAAQLGERSALGDRGASTGGREVIASNASQAKTIRAASGISAPDEAVRVAAAVDALVARAHDPRDARERRRRARRCARR